MQMETSNVNIYNLIILDESGSMSSVYDETLQAVNEAICGIRKNQEEFGGQNHFVSIVTFEGNGMDGVKVRRDRVPVIEVADFTRKDYCPGGCTPFYDAMGKSIMGLEPHVRKEDKVMVTVITDGYENSSVEYSGRAIKALVERKRAKGWAFAYIGANQDAVEAARNLNIRNALNFEANGAGVLSMSVKFRSAGRRFAKLCSKAAPGTSADYSCLFDGTEEADGKGGK